MGAGRVITTDISKYRLKMARELGADAVIEAKEDVPGRLRAVNDNRLAELIIVCTGALSAFNQALQSVDRGGTVLFFASTEPGVDLAVPLSEFWRNGVKLMPSYGNSPLDATVAIELIRTGRIPVKKMITHRLPLEETGKGFQLVAESNESMKVIIEPHKK
ncbi:MAG: zinc-binding dehydrogenase, partial [bacterium]